MNFQETMKQKITLDGPVPVDDFMNSCVSYYYSNHEAFGQKGDFITAPEISQMFGEMVGVWAAQQWLNLDQPSAFALVECGPGRGTLMADLLRSTKNVQGFHDAAQITMIENSEKRREEQRKALSGYDNVRWAERLESFDMPVILVANEFLDALPIKQFMFRDGAWHERVVGLDDKGAFCFGLRSAAGQGDFPKGKDGDIYEVSPVREAFVSQLYDLLQVQKGAALLIDYGHEKSAFGDTLQAMRDHAYVDVLEMAGEADLTSHVDFEPLLRDRTARLRTQQDFLEGHGIGLRAAMLKRKADTKQAQDIDAALRRLCDPKEMGSLFKVMEISCFW